MDGSNKTTKDGLLTSAKELDWEDDSLFEQPQASSSSRERLSEKARSKLERELQDVINNPSGYHTKDEFKHLANGPRDRVTKAASLIDRGADPNLPGLAAPALHEASLRCPIDMVKMLLEKGALVNAPGGMYGNALQAATSGFNSNGSTIQLLLDHGADVNAEGGKYRSALGAACTMGRLEVVDLFLRRGAAVNDTGRFEGSPLEAAYRLDPKTAMGKHREEILMLLLKHGALTYDTPSNGQKDRAEPRTDPKYASEQSHL